MSDEQSKPGPSPHCPYCGAYSAILEDHHDPDEVELPPPTAHLICQECQGVSFFEMTLRPATEDEVRQGGEELARVRRESAERKKERTAP